MIKELLKFLIKNRKRDGKVERCVVIEWLAVCEQVIEWLWMDGWLNWLIGCWWLKWNGGIVVVVLCVDGGWWWMNRIANCWWMNDLLHIFLLIMIWFNDNWTKKWLKEKWKEKVMIWDFNSWEWLIDWLTNVKIKDNQLISFFLIWKKRRKKKDKYLVDPASSHMLVLKIKPCMPKFRWIFRTETADGSINQS